MLMRTVRKLVVGAGIGLAVAIPATAETLGDALVSAYRHSNLLDQNRALLRAADEGVAEAVSALRPVVDFVARATYAYNQTRHSF